MQVEPKTPAPSEYTHRGAPQVLHDAKRLARSSGPRGEAPEYIGCDVIIVRDGRIAALYIFLDEATAEFSRSASAKASIFGHPDCCRNAAVSYGRMLGSSARPTW
jgi:hypothetical protein